MILPNTVHISLCYNPPTPDLSRWIAARSVSTGVLPSREAMTTNMESGSDVVSSSSRKHDGHH